MPLEDWPSNPSRSQRRSLILDAVKTGARASIEWCPITLSDGENTLVVNVSCDSLKIDGVRMMMDAVTEQLIADQIEALMLTPKIVDQIWAQTPATNRLSPQTADVTNLSTAAMVDYSSRVDANAAKKGAATGRPFANVGKDWVLVPYLFTEKARTGCPKPSGGGQCVANYGWLTTTNPWGGIHTDPTATLPGVYAIQGGPNGGTVHDIGHVDYSQQGRWVQRYTATLNGTPVDLANVYTGKLGDKIARLVSHQGALADFRMPTGGPTPAPPPPPAQPPPSNPPKQPPPVTKPPPTAGTTVAAAGGGGGAGTPVAFSLLGAAGGAIAGGTLWAGLGGLAGLALGALLKPKPSSSTAVAEPMRELGACEVWAIRSWEWDPSYRVWQDVGTLFYEERPAGNFMQGAPPYYGAAIFCGYFGNPDWSLDRVVMNYAA